MCPLNVRFGWQHFLKCIANVKSFFLWLFVCLSVCIGPEKRPNIPYKVVDEGNGRFRIEFTTVEVGSYVIDVTVKELTVPNSPLIAKAYDAGLIKVTDIQDGVVGDLSTFRVDASKAGEYICS